MGEIVCLAFGPDSSVCATGSMDYTAKLWDVESGQEVFNMEHTAEIVALNFSKDGNKVSSSSFDYTSKIWDVKNGQCINTLEGHEGELSAS